MVRNLRVWLLALNAILLVGVLGASPAAASANSFKRDCCQNSTEGIGFCCNECCWFTKDCTFSSQCGDILPT